MLTGLDALGCLRDVDAGEVAAGFQTLHCAGRMQTVPVPGCAGELIIDVGHNPLAAQAIAEFLGVVRPRQRVVMLLGMLADKDPAAFVSALAARVDEWWLVSLAGERGLSAQQLQQSTGLAASNVRLYESVDQALAAGLPTIANQDILFATGSFLTVEAVLKATSSRKPLWINN